VEPLTIVLQPRSADGTDGKAQYKYSSTLPQRSIRLLRLDSTRHPILCCLETVALDQAPEFWALSYLWGSEAKPVSLKISNRWGQADGCIAVTKNCGDAIAALLPLMGVRHLWVDAVCINQSNLQEKQLQIPLMGEIYSQASLVVGHLHTDSMFSVGLLVHKMVQTIGNQKKFYMDSAASFLIFRALGALLQHPYFGRAWVLQEMVLARSQIILFGRDCIHLDHLLVIAKGQSEDLIALRGDVLPGGASRTQLFKLDELTWFIIAAASFRDHSDVVDRLRSYLAQKDVSQRLTIAEIVDHNVPLGAKDPRDQVYALLSLASDSTVPELQPNYSKAISNKEIFTKISWHYLQNGRHLNLFLSAGIAPRLGLSKEGERTPGLPSWAYDFAIGASRELRLENWAVQIERNRQAGLTCRLSSDGEQLSIYGATIDTVSFVAPRPALPFPASGDALGYSTMLSSNLDMVADVLDETQAFVKRHCPELYPSGITRDEAYWRTMLMDRLWDQTPAPAEAEAILAGYREAAPMLRGNAPPPKKTHKALQGMSQERVLEAIQHLGKVMTRLWMPYSFVALKSGLMGWAPYGVEAGDMFCLFDGCIAPFVLRPTLSGHAFTLLGDGYVHGFLPGQQPGIAGRVKQWIKVI